LRQYRIAIISPYNAAQICKKSAPFRVVVRLTCKMNRSHCMARETFIHCLYGANDLPGHALTIRIEYLPQIIASANGDNPPCSRRRLAQDNSL
jgi:hypothetical protein